MRATCIAFFLGILGLGLGTAAAEVRELPAVMVGTTKIRGSGLFKTDIDTVMFNEATALEGCYALALTRDPDLFGEVALTFTVAANGRVTSAKVGGPLAKMLGTCLRTKALGWTFPAAAKRKPVTVVQPLWFWVTMREMYDYMIIGDNYDPRSGWPRDNETDAARIYGALIASGAAPPSGSAPANARPRPSVKLGVMKVTGGLDREIVNRFVKRSLPRLSFCYEKELSANAKLAGTVSVAYTIEASGNVKDATAKGVHPSVETCVAGVLSSVQYPQPRGSDVSVSFPITYAAN